MRQDGQINAVYRTDAAGRRRTTGTSLLQSTQSDSSCASKLLVFGAWMFACMNVSFAEQYTHQDNCILTMCADMRLLRSYPPEFGVAVAGLMHTLMQQAPTSGGCDDGPSNATLLENLQSFWEEPIPDFWEDVGALGLVAACVQSALTYNCP